MNMNTPLFEIVGLAEKVQLGRMSLRDAVISHFHLFHPPIPNEMLNAAVEALGLAHEGLWDVYVPMPEGLQFKGVFSEVSAIELIDTMMLWPFVYRVWQEPNAQPVLA